MFNTSDSVPRSEGAVSRLAQKLRKRPMQTIGKKRAPAQGEMKFALPDEMHSTYAPYSPYVTTPYGRALKAATTKGKPRRMYTRGYVPKYKEEPVTHVDPRTHKVLGTGTYSVLSREKPKGSPLFRDVVQHPTTGEKKIHYGFTQSSGLGTKRKVGDVMATVVGKYPAYHKDRYRAAAYLKARFGIESEKIRNEMYGKGPSEQEIRTAQRSAHKDILGKYKKQVQEEAGGERISVRETRDRMRKLIDREIQAHRDYRAGELRESRAIIHARGVPLNVAKAENEKISDYVSRLGEMAKARKTGLEGVQKRGVGRVQGILERGVKKIDPQITPNVLPEEIQRRAGKLVEGLRQEEASSQGPLSDIQRTEISKHLKGGMTRVRTKYKGKPQPMESRVEKLYGRMQRLRDLSRTPGGEANIREGLVRSKKVFQGIAPTITSVEKEGYPYLKRAGIGLGLAGGLIGGAYLTKKIFFPPRRKQQQKQLNFAVPNKPGVGKGIEKLIPFAKPRNRDLPRLTRLRKARDWYRRKTIGQVKKAYGITGEEVVNLPIALRNVQGLQSETAEKLSVARKQTRVMEAESERMVAKERAATGPLIEAEAQKRYERGYNLGKREEAERGKSYREEQVANVRETLGAKHKRAIGNLKWAGAGLITGAGAGGYIIGRGKRQRDHEFSILSKLGIKHEEGHESGPVHDIATGAIEGGLAYPASEYAYRKLIGKGVASPLKKIAVGGVVGGLATGLVGVGVANLLRARKKIKAKEQNMHSRLKLIQFERKKRSANQRLIVAKDRYMKQIHQKDIDTANRHYVRTALLGGAIGALTKKPSTALSKAVLTGSAVGVGTQALVRAHTAETRDVFGEKSWEGKREEKIPQYVGAGILGIAGLRKLRKKAFSLKGRIIYFDDQDKDWLADAAHKALYRRDYSSAAHAQKVRKWFGRGQRTVTDIQQSRSGVVPVDARGRPRKREWEKPWVAAAGTILALRGGFWGLGKLREGVRNAPIKSVVGQVREGFLSGDYSKKVPGLQKVGQAYQGFKKDVKKLVYKEAKDPKYTVPKINPKTNKPFSPKQMEKMLATEGQRAEFRDIAAGKKNKLAFVPTKKTPSEEKEWQSRLGEIQFRSVKWEDNPLYPKDQKKDVRRIPISKIVSHQNTIKRHIVEEYKKKPGKALPTLQKVGDKYYVEDGNHRIVSKMEKGEKTVRASIREMRSRLREIRFAQHIPYWDIRDERGKSARVYAPGSQRRHRQEMPEWKKKDTQRHILEAAIIGTAGLGGLGIRAAGKRGFKLGREAEAALAGHPPGVKLKTILGYPFKVVESGAHTPKDPIPFSSRLREILFDQEGRRPLLTAEIGAGALAAGAGVYGLLRHPGRAPVRGAMKAIRERAQAHGFARVHMHDKPTGFLGKLVSEISEPADIHHHVTANRTYYKTKSKSVVFDPENTGKLQSPLILGKMNKTAKDIRQHKLKEYTIARKMGLNIPQTETLGNPYTMDRSWIAKPATGSMSHALTIDDFMAHNPIHHDLINYKVQKKALGPLKGNTYYKSDAKLSHHPGVKRYHVEQALKHPDRYVRQKKLDIAKEYRVHMIGGEPMGVSSARHSVRQFFLNRNRPAEVAATKMLKRVDPKLKQNLLAMDIVRTKKGGWHVIETNPGHDSGFLTPTSGSAMDLRGPHALYKSVTGRYSKLVSGAGGAAAAAGTGGAGLLLTRKKAQSS